MTSSAQPRGSADWFKSSYSNDQAQACVEGARLPMGAMAVRDSKVVDGPVLLATSAAWTTFVEAASEGRLSR